jgi:hypothetical protein
VILFYELLFFPFSFLDAKGGEVFIYISRFIWSLACKTLIMLSRLCDMDFKTFMVCLQEPNYLSMTCMNLSLSML